MDTIEYKFFNEIQEKSRQQVITSLLDDWHVRTPTLPFCDGYLAGIKWLNDGEIEKIHRSDNDCFTRTWEWLESVEPDDDPEDDPITELFEHALCNEVAEALGHSDSCPPATFENVEFEHGFCHAVSWASTYIKEAISA